MNTQNSDNLQLTAYIQAVKSTYTFFIYIKFSCAELALKA